MSDDIKTLDTGRAEMKYFSFGSGQRTMVIIPGVSIRSVMYSAAAVRGAYRLFSKDFTVYVFDRREDIPENYSIDEMAEDIYSAVSMLGLTDIYMLGVSQGGMIAMTLAARHPEAVKKLILAATSAKDNDLCEELFTSSRELARAGKKKEINLLFAQKLFTDGFYQRYKEVFAAMADSITDDDLVRFERISAPMQTFDITDELDRITAETLVLVGSDDRVFGTEPSVQLSRRLGCELYVFEGFGHAVYDETNLFKEKAYGFFMKEDP